MISGPYQPKEYEVKAYQRWQNLLTAEQQALKTKPSKVISFLMAPPNVTGSLHLGHALQNTMIDTLARWQRLRGQKVVWLPGIDHAGIATQNVVEKKLKKEGRNRFQLGRTAFLQEVWRWKEEYGQTILEQFRSLGITPDWSRTRFTMDPAYVHQVEEAFMAYHKAGLVYRAYRTINWCPRCRTVISDLEIDHADKLATLYYLQYGPIIVATVRPETILGDVAIAVNPKDKRYISYIGKKIQMETLATTGSLDTPQKKIMELPVVADKVIDPTFGTGAIKVTPAHDITDYEIAQRHNLSLAQVIGEDGRLNERAGKYAGLKTAEAGKKIVEDLRFLGLLTEEQSTAHHIPICSRCATTLEVLPSLQWFVKMEPLAKLAIQAIEKNKVLYNPHKFKAQALIWLKGVRDWCISRSLWWGQQMPVWYCANCKVAKLEDCPPKVDPPLADKINDGGYVVSREPPGQPCPHCQKISWERTEEVFDTWFSSALWPFATLYQETEQKWYPLSVAITARDILHLWIARMIFSGLYFKKKAPFQTVIIHPTILAKDGRRMSKSLGTGIDPLDLIKKYGADATRFGLLWQMRGRQDIRFDETHVAGGAKFANKVWNATRFVLLQEEKLKSNSKLTSADKKIISALKKTKRIVDRSLTEYKFADALGAIYNFLWLDFCDRYLESCKNESKNNSVTLRQTLEQALILLHPFMPFLTETLWSELEHKESLLQTSWPA